MRNGASSGRELHWIIETVGSQKYATTTVLIYARKAVSMVVHHWTIEVC
jgi:hypothetical protein